MSSPDHTKEAGLAGASGGTILIGLINLLGPGPFKEVAIILSPSMAVILSALWLYIRRRLSANLGNSYVEGELNKAEELLARIEADPNATQSGKDRARAEVETLRSLQFQIHRKWIEAVIEN